MKLETIIINIKKSMNKIIPLLKIWNIAIFTKNIYSVVKFYFQAVTEWKKIIIAKDLFQLHYSTEILRNKIK